MIDLTASPEQRQLVDSVAAFVREHFPSDRAGGGTNPADPRGLKASAALGLLGLGLPETAAGTGYGPVEEAMVNVVMGSLLAPPALLAAQVAAHVAVAHADSDTARAIASGEKAVALALPAADGGLSYLLVDGNDADIVLLAEPGALQLAAVSAFTDRRDSQAMDPAITLERATLADVVAPAEATTPIPWRRLRLLLAAQLAGIATTMLDTSVGYAGTRHQFGRAIGSFQAVAHHCADMAVRSRAATAAVSLAAVAERNGEADAPYWIAAAFSVASEAAIRNAEMCIRVHGGIGFTDEGGIHRFLKRAILLDRIGGGVRAGTADLIV